MRGECSLVPGYDLARCGLGTGVCIGEGMECNTTEECCGALECIFDPTDMRFECSSMCVPTSGACLSNADCCDGACIDNSCMPISGCLPLFSSCTGSAECCSNFCFDGQCALLGG